MGSRGSLASVARCESPRAQVPECRVTAQVVAAPYFLVGHFLVAGTVAYAQRSPSPWGGGRPASAGRVGVTVVPHLLRRRRPTPDCLRQSDPPLKGSRPTRGEGVAAAQHSESY